MPESPAVADSPIMFSTGDGKHLMIPLTSLYFDATGALKADRWPLYTTHQALVDPLLARFRAAGFLRAGPQPPGKPSFRAVAVTTGAAGILAEIEISNVAPNSAAPANSAADFRVTETETYANIEPVNLIGTIGATPNGGNRPGLVFVPSAPPVGLPRAGTYAMTAAAPGDPANVDIPKHAGAGNAFALRTRAGGADAPATSVVITVDAPANKFTLVAKWTKAQNVAMTGLAAAFAYVITVTPPEGGYLAPAAGKTVLSGGSDAVSVDPVKASAIVLASQ